MTKYLNTIGLQNLDKYIVWVYSNLFKFSKSEDPLIAERIKYIIIEEENRKMPLSAICEVKIISGSKPKPIDSISGSKKAAKKLGTLKTEHNFDYYEKSPIFPFFSENNCKILCFCINFEKMIRYNILDCVNKLFKIDDLDKDMFLNRLEDTYKDKFINPFISDLIKYHQKDFITYDIDLTVESSQ
jgi:hypothetical protein